MAKKSGNVPRGTNKDHTDLTHKPIARTKDAKQMFPDILRKNLGLISRSCEDAGISRITYYQWRESDQKFAELCDEALEHTGDLVESVLHELITEQKNPQATMFYCKTKLKDRGFVERKEVDNTHVVKHEEALKELGDE